MAARKKIVRKAAKTAANASKPKVKASGARKSKAKASVRVANVSVLKKPAAKTKKARASTPSAKKTPAAKSSAKTATKPDAKKGKANRGTPVAPKAVDTIVKKKAPEASVKTPTSTPAERISPAPPVLDKVLETKTTVELIAPAVAISPSVAAKAPHKPTPTKTTERDEQGGEQKTMKNSANRLGFKLNEFVVYPAHGVGQIVALEEQEVAGFRLELFVINFAKDKMTLRVPTSKVVGVGMRKLSDADGARRSLEILTGRARIKRTMWSRRAQEYEAKINSGDINAIAEVVRDLYRSDAQPEQSYSERQLYEAALDRMMREIAAVQKLSDAEALKVIETQLKKNAKRVAKPDAAEGDDSDIEEAA